MFRIVAILTLLLGCQVAYGQVRWEQVDSLFSPLPPSIQVFRSTDAIDGKPNIAFYVKADLKDRDLTFTTDTALNRRLTPQQFYDRNNKPLVTVNCTFFSFETNRNLSLLVKNRKTVSYNIHIVPGHGSDTLLYKKFLGSALGISKRRKADVAWIYADTGMKWPVAVESNPITLTDSLPFTSLPQFKNLMQFEQVPSVVPKWKMETAVGGGPVLVQNGAIRITNNEERKFMGKAINDKHPRTAIGYTNDNKLIILVIQGRFPGTAEGATLTQAAQMLKDLSCIEALNLDGGGSSCLLINGKETITPSDNKKQRATPAVLIIQNK
jgi:hypothetical protein